MKPEPLPSDSIRQEIARAEQLHGENLAEIRKRLDAVLLQKSELSDIDSKLNSDDEFQCRKMVGFYDLARLERLLKLLHEGKKIIALHEAYGKMGFYMNPQRNRLLVVTTYKSRNVPPTDGPSEANALQILANWPCKFRICTDPDPLFNEVD